MSEPKSDVLPITPWGNGGRAFWTLVLFHRSLACRLFGLKRTFAGYFRFGQF